MYRMLIVDDEKNERDCILYLLQESGLALEIREAEDGVDAQKQLSKWPAQILLTDVQMPRMDGLELVRQAVALQPDIKPVIFSGYADFEYAKTAISLGVSNYILKPVVPEELTKTIQTLIHQLDDERSATQLQENQKLIVLQYALQQSISGRSSLQEIDPNLSEQLTSFRYMLMFCFKDSFLPNYFTEFFQSTCDALQLDAVPLNPSSEQALLFLRNPIEDAADLCSRLLSHIHQQFHTNCYITISRPLTEYPSLKDAFSFLEQQMEQRFWAPDSYIYLPELTPSQENEVFEDDSQLIPMIKNAVSAHNAPLLQKYLDHLFQKYSLQSNQSQVYVKFLFSNLLTILYPAVPETMASSLAPLETLISNLYLQPDISEIFRIVNELAKQVLTGLTPRNEPIRKEVTTVLSYIDSHYDKELSVEILASIVYLTPDYLSRLFKKSTGKSISQYIRQLRMEKASEALLNTNHKIIDIAVHCGYPNYSYFCQSFREYYILSPEKYRQKNL